jgi:hypothetical protein
VTPGELSGLYDIKRTLERIKEYCENRSLSYDENYERWKHVASEAEYGLLKVKDIERWR